MIGNGCVIAIGGNEDKIAAKESILGRFVERAGGALARIVIIPFASAEPVQRAQTYTEIFRQLGACGVTTILSDHPVTESDFRAIRCATGLFVTGGDHLQLMDRLRQRGMVTAIRDAVRDGAVYAGTSAGAAAVAEKMLSGVTAEDGTESTVIVEGLGLVPDVIVDQHFSGRNRLARLKAATAEKRMRGFGIDENTAIVWTSDGISVEGAGNVTVVHADHHDDPLERIEVIRPEVLMRIKR